MQKFRFRSTQAMIILATLSLVARVSLSSPKNSISMPTKIVPKEFSSPMPTIYTPIMTEISIPTITQQPTITLTPTAYPTITPTIGATLMPSPTGMFGAPSLSAEDVESVLQKRGSPAVGNGQVFWDLGVAYEIDPAYFLAFFAKESSMGADPNWRQTNNPGNIICLQNCVSRFQSYATWAEGAEAWYSLMARKYVGQDIYTIMYQYAPYSDGNNPDKYAETVLQLVDQWRTR